MMEPIYVNLGINLVCFYYFKLKIINNINVLIVNKRIWLLSNIFISLGTFH